MFRIGNSKKAARAACRELAAEYHTTWWPLCWTKQQGYYPAADWKSKDTNHICWVHKDGRFLYASKENERKHNLKGNVPWIDYATGKRR